MHLDIEQRSLYTSALPESTDTTQIIRTNPFLLLTLPKMIDIPFWLFFWLATVLIQALFHYGLIGRRSHYGYNEEDEIEILTQEVVETDPQEGSGGTGNQVQEYGNRNLENNAQVNLKLSDRDQIETSRISLLKQNSVFDSDSDWMMNRVNDDGIPRSPVHVSAYEDCYGQDPADENDYDYDHASTSCDENDYNSEGKWRYELMKNYYSSSYTDEYINNSDAQSGQYNPTLRVVPTPQVEDDILYENGTIKWAIKRKQPPKRSHNHCVKSGNRGTKWDAPGYTTSIRRRFVERCSPRSSGRHVGFALPDDIDEHQQTNTIRPLSQ